MAKSTSQFAGLLEALSELSQSDMAVLTEVLTKGAPAPKAKKARITVRVNGPEEQEKYHTVATIWKIKGDFEEPMVGIRDHDDLVSLIEDLEIAELEVRPDEDDS